MKRIKYILLMSIFFWGCPKEEEVPANYFDETRAFSERYAAEQDDFVLELGEYFIFQIENKNQDVLFSFDRDTNNAVTLDTYDPDGDGIQKEDRGIDQVPVRFRVPENPKESITLKYRLDTRYETTFRLLDENQNLIFELTKNNNTIEFPVPTDGEKIYYYQLESIFTSEDLTGDEIEFFNRNDTLIPIQGMIIQPDWNNIPSDERVILADNYFEEDTYILISDRECPGCNFKTTSENEGALESLNLDDFDLRGADFSFSDFSRSTFRRALFGVPESGKIISPTNFNNARFISSVFTSAQFISGDDIGTNTNLDIDMTNALFDQSNFVGSTILGCYGLGVSFEGCTMPYSIVNNNNFQKIKLIGTDLPYSEITGNDFAFAEMTGAELPYSDVSNTSFRRAIMSFTDLTAVTAIGTDFCFVTKIDIKIDSLITDESTLCDSLFRSTDN